MGKDKKALLSTPSRYIQEGKIQLYSFFGTTGKLVVSFTPRPLCPWQRTPGNYWTRSCMGPSTVLNVLEKQQTFTAAEIRSPDRPTWRLSQYTDWAKPVPGLTWDQYEFTLNLLGMNSNIKFSLNPFGTEIPREQTEGQGRSYMCSGHPLVKITLKNSKERNLPSLLSLRNS